jgi:hypothetical protein
MAKKKKRARPAAKKTAKKTAKKKALKKLKKKVGKIRYYSPFEHDFRNFLKEPGDPNLPPWSWPPIGQLKAVSLGEIAEVMNLLGSAWVAGVPPAPGANPPVTFLDRVATRVNSFGWPLKPAGYSSSAHLYEISRVVDTMLEALNGGGGGGPPGWPPNK